MAKQFELEYFGPVAIYHVGENLDAVFLAEHKIKVSSVKKTIENGV